jgi:RNA polymerase sigma-B factor
MPAVGDVLPGDELAVDRYGPDFGNPFVPYAVACVVGEIKRYLRDTSWPVHVG